MCVRACMGACVVSASVCACVTLHTLAHSFSSRWAAQECVNERRMAITVLQRNGWKEKKITEKQPKNNATKTARGRKTESCGNGDRGKKTMKEKK